VQRGTVPKNSPVKGFSTSMSLGGPRRLTFCSPLATVKPAAQPGKQEA
jgi:hypothetical protein